MQNPNSKPVLDILFPSSKVSFRDIWLEAKARGYPIDANWLHVDKPLDTSADKHTLWKTIFRDIDNSRGVIACFKEGETPKGSLVEIGYALAKGKPVYLICSNKMMEEHTVFHYKGVYHIGHYFSGMTLDRAVFMMNKRIEQGYLTRVKCFRAITLTHERRETNARCSQ